MFGYISVMFLLLPWSDFLYAANSQHERGFQESFWLFLFIWFNSITVCARPCARNRRWVSHTAPSLSSQSQEEADKQFLSSGGAGVRKHISPSVEGYSPQRYPQLYLPSHIPFLHGDFDILPIEKGYLVFFFFNFLWIWVGLWPWKWCYVTSRLGLKMWYSFKLVLFGNAHSYKPTTML